MGIVKRGIFVNAAPKRVFDYISDLPRHIEWAHHRIDIKPASPTTDQVGATFTSGHVGKRPRDMVTITEIAPNSRFTYEARGPEGHDRWFFEVQPEGNGTRLMKGFQ